MMNAETIEKVRKLCNLVMGISVSNLYDLCKASAEAEQILAALDAPEVAVFEVDRDSYAVIGEHKTTRRLIHGVWEGPYAGSYLAEEFKWGRRLFTAEAEAVFAKYGRPGTHAPLKMPADRSVMIEKACAANDGIISAGSGETHVEKTVPDENRNTTTPQGEMRSSVSKSGEGVKMDARESPPAAPIPTTYHPDTDADAWTHTYPTPKMKPIEPPSAFEWESMFDKKFVAEADNPLGPKMLFKVHPCGTRQLALPEHVKEFIRWVLSEGKTGVRPASPPEPAQPSLGLYQKFRVERTDGQSATGAKHDGCDYFVLDLSCDPYAEPAVRAYADTCEKEFPQLAKDLRHKMDHPERITRAIARQEFAATRLRMQDKAKPSPADSPPYQKVASTEGTAGVSGDGPPTVRRACRDDRGVHIEISTREIYFKPDNESNWYLNPHTTSKNLDSLSNSIAIPPGPELEAVKASFAKWWEENRVVKENLTTEKPPPAKATFENCTFHQCEVAQPKRRVFGILLENDNSAEYEITINGMRAHLVPLGGAE